MLRLPLALALALAAALAAQPSPPAQNNLVYEIFVRSFADGDHDPRGIGDLKGIVDELDPYLNDGDPKTHTDLDVGVLWLMPIFPSPSYHGYDVVNYRDINADYGTMADFQNLIAKAHQRGVRVILDVPFNHTSDQHPWFREAINDPSSPKRRFYFVQADSHERREGGHSITSASGEQLQDFGFFSPSLPQFKLDKPGRRPGREASPEVLLDLGGGGF